MTHTLARPAKTPDPTPRPGPSEEVRRDIGTFHQSDLLAILGAGAAALSATTLVFHHLAPFSGKVGFVIMAFLAFLAFYALLVSLDENGPAVRARLAAAIIHGVAFIAVLTLAYMIGFTLVRGIQALRHLNFFTEDLRDAGPLEPLTVGGITHAMVGTLEMIAIALAITIPLGLICAIFLSEIPGAFSRFVRTVVEAMTALPSIVAGLFILATFILILGFELSGLAAALAISVMMLPIIIRAADVVLRLVPGSLREASQALGSGQWRTVWHVVLPTARSGLTTAVILGTARGIGETSPVLLTAGYTANMNVNPFKGQMVSLPLATFELVKSPQPNMIARGFGTAAVLLMLVLILFIVARIIGGRPPGSLSKRQEHRRVLASQRDAARFSRRGGGGTAGVASLLVLDDQPQATPPRSGDHRSALLRRRSR